MEQVSVAGFRRCSETLTRKADISAELIVQEHFATSSDVVVALEGQNVIFPSEL